MYLKSISSDCSRWLCRSATWFSCFWVTADLKQVFSRRRAEKLLSAMQLVTGMVRNKRRKLVNSGSIFIQASFALRHWTMSFILPIWIGFGFADRHKSPNIARWSFNRSPLVSSPRWFNSNCQASLEDEPDGLLIVSSTTDSMLQTRSKAGRTWKRLAKQPRAVSTVE